MFAARYVCVGLTLLTALSTAGPPLQAQEKDSAEREAAARLARHAHLFENMTFGPPVNDRKANPNGEIDLSGGMLVDYAVDPNAPKKTVQELLQLLADRSSLVIRGTALRYKSNFTSSRSFLYSDWQFKVLEVFKNPDHLYVGVGDTITVTRSGGAFKWNGQTVVAHDFTFPAFRVGEEYVLFLAPITDDPTSYRASGWGSFRISDDKVHYLIDPNDRQDDLAKATSEMTATSFIETVREGVR